MFFRLTKMEVQTQEKNDEIKSELREVSQRVRQLDWQNSKMEAALEAIKIDTTGLKHGQDQIRGYQAGSGDCGRIFHTRTCLTLDNELTDFYLARLLHTSKFHGSNHKVIYNSW